MVIVASITLVLVLVGVVAYIWGTIQLSRYAFRISTGRGLATLLFPPYTFYFAFWGFEEEGKETPTAAWLFGLLVSLLLLGLFWQPLQLLLAGEYDKLTATSPGKAAAAEYGSPDTGTDDEPQSESVPAQEPDAGASSSESESGSEADAGATGDAGADT